MRSHSRLLGAIGLCLLSSSPIPHSSQAPSIMDMDGAVRACLASSVPLDRI